MSDLTKKIVWAIVLIALGALPVINLETGPKRWAAIAIVALVVVASCLMPIGRKEDSP